MDVPTLLYATLLAKAEGDDAAARAVAELLADPAAAAEVLAGLDEGGDPAPDDAAEDPA